MTFRKKLLAVVGFLVALAVPAQTGYIIGQGSMIRNFTADGAVSATATVVDAAGLPFIANVEASGSTLVTSNDETGKNGAKYAAACFPNPLSTGSGANALNAGTGLLLQLMYHNIANPTAVGGDIAFVNDCLEDGTGALVPLLDNVSTVSGAYAILTTPTVWQGSGRKFIKFGLRGAVPAGFKARITGIVTDIIGE